MSQPPDLDACQAPPAGQPSHWQFSLRDLFMWTAVAAVYLAAFVAVIPDLHANVPWRVWLLPLVIAIVWLPFHIVLTLRDAKRRLGSLDIMLARQRHPVSWFVESCWLPLVIIVAFHFAGESLALRGWPPENSWTIAVRFMAALVMLYELLRVIWMLTHRSVELGGNGMVLDGHIFLSWRRVRRYRRLFDHENNLVLDHGFGYRTVAIVPPEQREAVEALLKEKLGERFRTAE